MLKKLRLWWYQKHALIVIYGLDDCKWCLMAKLLCENLNIEYIYRNIEKDNYVGEVFDKYGEKFSVPKMKVYIFLCEFWIDSWQDLRSKFR